MRWSKAFIPTLKEEPARAESVSHRLLQRAGMIRQAGSGMYSLLPLAQRVRKRIIEIIREEMDKIGGQEFVLPALNSADIWRTSGRWESMGEIMFRLTDRREAELALAVTHEELFASLAAKHLSSYRQLPQIWYQVHTKFRDEPRPRAGLLRVREFTMKDSYSFDVDEAGLDRAFALHEEAYCHIFKRCGLAFEIACASSGIMGGAQSTEFLLVTEAGEDSLVKCASCGYAANIEKATGKCAPVVDTASEDTLHKFPTPGVRTIEALTNFEGGAAAEHQIKTLVYVADQKLIAVLLRGDHELNLNAIAECLNAQEVRPATSDEVFSALGAHPGSLGAVHLKSKRKEASASVDVILCDRALAGRRNMVTGANEDDFHYRGVSIERDIEPDQFGDFRVVRAGDSCTCGANLQIVNALEIGHIFKLGTRYSEAAGACTVTESGDKVPLAMGSYGIGVERLMAAIVEQSHDENGIIWPIAVAPYEVVIVPVNTQDAEQVKFAEKLYDDLKERGIDVLLDDRDERAGVKFNDCDLIGIPVRITVGKKLAEGKVELFKRADRSKLEINASDALQACLTSFT